MIKALFLIFEPEVAWNRVARSQRGFGYILLFYLLPMMLLVACVEGFGLIEWGRRQSGLGDLKRFTPREAFVAEAVQLGFMALIILICAHFIKALGETFHGRHTYTETFTVVAYGLSPVFMLRLLDVIPSINLWIPWAIGILFTVKILYHGVPRIMLPDPPHALGLFFMSTFLIVTISAAERFVTIGYLNGNFKPMSDVISQIASKLHF